MKNERSNRGFTFIELLVAVAIVGIVTIFIYSFFIQQRTLLKRQRSLAEVSQYSLTTSDILSRTIVNAGYDLQRGTGLEAASDHYLVIVADMNNNSVVSSNEIIAFGASLSNNPLVGTETVEDCDSQASPKDCTKTPLQFSFYYDMDNDGVVESNEKKILSNFKLQLGLPPYTLYRYHLRADGSQMETPDIMENNLDYLLIRYRDMNNNFLPCQKPPTSDTTCSKAPYPETYTSGSPIYKYTLNKSERRRVRKIEIEYMTRASSKDITGSLSVYKSHGTYPYGSIATYNASGVDLGSGSLTCFNNDGYLRRIANVEITPRNFVSEVCGRVMMSLQVLTAPCDWDASISGPKKHTVTASITDLYGEPKLNTTITFNISSTFGSFAVPGQTRLTQTQVASGSSGYASVSVYHWQVPPVVTDRSDILNFRGPTNVTVNASFVDDVNFSPACTAAASINAPFVAGPPMRVAFVNPEETIYTHTAHTYHVRDTDADGKFPVDLDGSGAQDQSGGSPVFGTIDPNVTLYYPLLTSGEALNGGGSDITTCGPDTSLTSSSYNNIAVMGVEITDLCGNPTTLGWGNYMRRLRLKPILVPTSGAATWTTIMGRVRPYVNDSANSVTSGFHTLPQDSNKAIVLQDPSDTFVDANANDVPVYYRGDSPLVIEYSSPTYAERAEYPSSGPFTSSALNLSYTFFNSYGTQSNRGTSDMAGNFVAGIFIDPNMSASDLGSPAVSLVTTLRAVPATYGGTMEAVTSYYQTQWPLIPMNPLPLKLSIPIITSAQADLVEGAGSVGIGGLGNKPNHDYWVDILACPQSLVINNTGIYSDNYAITPFRPSFYLQDACGNAANMSSTAAVNTKIWVTAGDGIVSPSAITLPSNSLWISYTTPSSYSGTSAEDPRIHLRLTKPDGSTADSISYTSGLWGVHVNQCSGNCTMSATDFTDVGTTPPTAFGSATQCQPANVIVDKIASVISPNQVSVMTGGYTTSLAGRTILFNQTMDTYTVSSNTTSTITTATNLLSQDAVATKEFEVYDPVCFNITTILERQGTPLASTVGGTAMLTPCNANVWINFAGCQAQSSPFYNVELMLEPTDSYGNLVSNRNASLGDTLYLATGGTLAVQATYDRCGWGLGGGTQNYDRLYQLTGSSCFRVPVYIGNATGFTDAYGNYITTNIGVRAFFPNRDTCNPDVTCTPNQFAHCQGSGVTCYRPGVIKVTSECRQVSACLNNQGCSGSDEIFNGEAIHLNSCTNNLSYRVYDCNRNKNKTVVETIASSYMTLTLKQGTTTTDTEHVKLTETLANVVGSNISIPVSTTGYVKTSVNSALFTGTITINSSIAAIPGYLDVPYGQAFTMTSQYIDPDDSNDNKCTMTNSIDWIAPVCTYGCMNALNCTYYPTNPTMVVTPGTNNLVLTQFDCSENASATLQEATSVLVQMNGATKEVEIVTLKESAGTWPVSSGMPPTLSGSGPNTITTSANSPIFAGKIPVTFASGNRIYSNNGTIDIPPTTAGTETGMAIPFTTIGSYTISSTTSPNIINYTGTPFTAGALVGYYLYIPGTNKANLYLISTNTTNTLTVSAIIQNTAITNLTNGTATYVYKPKSGCTFNFTLRANMHLFASDNFDEYTNGTQPPTPTQSAPIPTWTYNTSPCNAKIALPPSSITYTGNQEAALGGTSSANCTSSAGSYMYMSVDITGYTGIVVCGHLSSYGGAFTSTQNAVVQWSWNPTSGYTTVFTRTSGTASGYCYGSSSDTAAASDGSCAPFCVAFKPTGTPTTTFSIRIQQKGIAAYPTDPYTKRARFDDFSLWGYY